MAVQASSNRFDWCDRLIEARQNYSAAECCNMIKNTLSQLKGADPDYVSVIRSRPVEQFPCRILFYPVYETTITATYTWDTTEQEKHTTKVTTGFLDTSPSYIKTTADVTTTHTERLCYNKTFFKSVFNDLSPSEYVGRNDERFYTLNHVNDLKGSIYNDGCVYTESDMERAILNAAKDYHKGDTYINQWSCTACMIPFIEVTVTFDGHKNHWYFNAHNGSWHTDGYLLSQKVSDAALETAERVKVPHLVTYLSSAAAILVSFTNMNWHHWFATIVSILVSLVGGIVMIREACAQNKEYLINIFGEEGDVSQREYKDSISTMCWSIGFLVFAALLAIIW